MIPAIPQNLHNFAKTVIVLFAILLDCHEANASRNDDYAVDCRVKISVKSRNDGIVAIQ